MHSYTALRKWYSIDASEEYRRVESYQLQGKIWHQQKSTQIMRNIGSFSNTNRNSVFQRKIDRVDLIWPKGEAFCLLKISLWNFGNTSNHINKLWLLRLGKNYRSSSLPSRVAELHRRVPPTFIDFTAILQNVQN